MYTYSYYIVNSYTDWLNNNSIQYSSMPMIGCKGIAGWLNKYHTLRQTAHSVYVLQTLLTKACLHNDILL